MNLKKTIKDIKNILEHPDVHELFIFFSTIFFVFAFGTAGYVLIEGWSAFDAFYMTVVTLSTIGYGEVHALSNAGRLFTILLIFLGVGVFSVVLTSLAHKVIQQEFNLFFTQRKVLRNIKRMNEHTIICGFGRLSRNAANGLKQANAPLVIVDYDEARCQEAINDGFTVVRGDASNEETLVKAGIKKAKRFVCLLPKDSDNLYSIITAKELNPELFVLTRAENDAGEKRLKAIGANKIVSPYRIGGQKIADGLLRPFVTEFLDLTVSTSNGELAIEEIQIPMNSPLSGASLKESELRQKTNVMVAAIISPDGKMHFNPSGETLIQVGSTLIGIGFKKDFVELERILIGTT